MPQNLTYEKAFQELSQIASDMESETISVDALADKVKRAAELVAFCQTKLKATETQVNNIIAQMDQNN